MEIQYASTNPLKAKDKSPLPAGLTVASNASGSVPQKLQRGQDIQGPCEGPQRQ